MAELGDLAISIDDEGWTAALEDVEAVIEQAVRAVFADVESDCQGRPCEVSVVLSDDERVRELNRDYREKDSATNVLSFPALECEGPGQLILEPGPVLLGDIIFALGVCQRECLEQEKTLSAHLSHLCVHGMLHLFGFDHIDDDEAEEMEAREIAILAKLGIANPYLSEAL